MTVASQRRVRFVDLRPRGDGLRQEYLNAFASVMDRGDFVLGDEVKQFESEFAQFCGVDHAVGVDSGFSAMQVALHAMGIGPGDEVITQANTFIATVSAIAATGAKPVLTDCDALGGVEPSLVDAAVTAQTRAVIAVHLFGRIGEIDALCEIARADGLHVLEDCAQANGASLTGRRGGSFGDVGCFSFYPTKNLGAFGDAGALITGNAEIAEAATAIRNLGQRTRHMHELTPLNRRLDTLQAAMLRVSLRRLEEGNRARGVLAEAYRERLQRLPVQLPPSDPPGRHVFHLFVLQCEGRDSLQATLASEGVETGIHYPIPLHLQPALRHLGYGEGAFPNAERLAVTSLSLPLYPTLTLDEVDHVTSVIRRHFGASA